TSLGKADLMIQPRFPESNTAESAGSYVAPMPSQVIKVLVQNGQEVQAGDSLLVLSSMKMENTITATASGTIDEVYAKEGSNIEAGFVLLSLTETTS
ncbi:MAG: acetyl-CoA carboxylase biotin carboxyl carrier protein subunit, partial [Bacteroidota bacterium]